MRVIKYLSIMAVAISLSFGIGCKKKEETAAVSSAPPMLDANASITLKKEEMMVVVPDSVKGKWKDVTLEVTNKKTSQKSAVKVPIGGETAISNTKLKVKVEFFFPELMMEGANMTSASNDPKNPSAYVSVTEDGREIWKGWLFSLFPTAHPFEHPDYGIILIDYARAS